MISFAQVLLSEVKDRLVSDFDLVYLKHPGVFFQEHCRENFFSKTVAWLAGFKCKLYKWFKKLGAFSVDSEHLKLISNYFFLLFRRELDSWANNLL